MNRMKNRYFCDGTRLRALGHGEQGEKADMNGFGSHRNQENFCIMMDSRLRASSRHGGPGGSFSTFLVTYPPRGVPSGAAALITMDAARK
jgi:hypothetical protein